MDAIVYTSNTGFTKEYAQMLGEETGLPVYDLKEARGRLAEGAEIIYLGWLLAGGIKGYNVAIRHYRPLAVAAVGMSADPGQGKQIREKYQLAEESFFLLQGGFELARLRGINRLMMKTMKATAGKALAKKNDRTSEEDDMLDLLTNGGSRVSREQLSPLLAWYAARK